MDDNPDLRAIAPRIVFTPAEWQVLREQAEGAIAALKMVEKNVDKQDVPELVDAFIDCYRAVDYIGTNIGRRAAIAAEQEQRGGH